MVNNVPLPVVIVIRSIGLIVSFLGILIVLFLGILKPEVFVNLHVKYFKCTMKWYGFEGEIKPTPKAKIICRLWFLFFLLVFGVSLLLTFLTFLGKLKSNSV